MNIGDLVRIERVPSGQGMDFLIGQVGFIMNSWVVMFDCGEWRLDKFDFARGDAEVIGEGR